MLRTLDDQSVNCIVTSPPYYGLRDYGVDGQIGLEETPEEYIQRLVDVFHEARRVLRDDGTLWVNIGDSYAGSGKGGAQNPENAALWKQGTNKGALSVVGTHNGNCKPKDLIGIPWLLAFALRADGWYLRQDIIWSKPNPMPESVTDRCTKAHEYIFLLSKSRKYYYDHEAIKEIAESGTDLGLLRGKKETTDLGVSWCAKSIRDRQAAGVDSKTAGNGLRNKRSVWEVSTKPYKEAHFATFPEDLIVPCILAGCPENGTVLDMFGGSGTTGYVASGNNRNAILIDLNPKYSDLQRKRCGMFAI